MLVAEAVVVKAIPLEVNPQAPSIEVDGTLVARGLGLEVGTFRELMDSQQVTVLCERGTGEDEGLVRASFYYDGKRVRLVLDQDGKVLQATR